MIFALPWTQNENWIERYLYDNSNIAGWVWVRQYTEDNGLIMWCCCYWTDEEVRHDRGYVETEQEGKSAVEAYLTRHGIKIATSKLACFI